MDGRPYILSQQQPEDLLAEITGDAEVWKLLSIVLYTIGTGIVLYKSYNTLYRLYLNRKWRLQRRQQLQGEEEERDPRKCIICCERPRYCSFPRVPPCESVTGIVSRHTVTRYCWIVAISLSACSVQVNFKSALFADRGFSAAYAFTMYTNDSRWLMK